MKKIIFTAALFLCTAAFGQNAGSATVQITEEPDTLPLGLTTNIDSLLNMWYAQHYLATPDDDCDSGTNPNFSDSVYRERIANLPVVVDMEYNAAVRNAIDSYTVRGRKLVSYLVGTFPFYEDIFVSALIKYDIPLELKYLPIIESALKPTAYSKAGAAGLWQFIYGTGRTYGLMSNSVVDDRYDIYLETDAAARHLRDLYDIFKDWGLAIAAYNCGPGNVNKAIIRSGGKMGFWDIYEYLPKETRGYLPSFIAATYVMHYYREHGICPTPIQSVDVTDTLVIRKNLHFEQISKMADISKADIKALNPQYLTEVIPGAFRPCVLSLPTKNIRLVLEAGDSIYAYRREELFPASKVKNMDDAMNNRQVFITHKIAQGETLGGIAIKYHTTVKNIKSWNNMKSDNIRAGKTLKIYSR